MKSIPSLSLLSRRDALRLGSCGFGYLALAGLANEAAASSAGNPLASRHPHFGAKAKRVIFMFMQGGPSHLDLFDPKPAMAKWDGAKFPGEIKYDNAAQASAKVLASPWKFQKRGQCGTEVSELLPHFSEIVDDVCLIRSMKTGVNNHGQSIRALNTGQTIEGQPSLGSWLTRAPKDSSISTICWR